MLTKSFTLFNYFAVLTFDKSGYQITKDGYKNDAKFGFFKVSHCETRQSAWRLVVLWFMFEIAKLS